MKADGRSVACEDQMLRRCANRPVWMMPQHEEKARNCRNMCTTQPDPPSTGCRRRDRIFRMRPGLPQDARGYVRW